MVTINKNPEPHRWTVFRNTPGALYQAIPELRDALLAEQGYICAYCMRGIPVRDRVSNETSRIDHIQFRENYPDIQLEYNNMVVCCPGCIDGTEHCEKSKSTGGITFSLFRLNIEESISYSLKDGQIKSSNAAWDLELNTILCLNNRLIKRNRNEVLDAISFILEKKNWKNSELENKLAEWSNLNRHGRLKPYCGIVRWYLQKKLRNL